ncbi:succinate dehydrogenase, hydrophobic membrane anchor protein [Camelimonas sp. ID_303_24]
MATQNRSFRTPRANVTGLGAAHHGTEHFWRQRLSAFANLLLILPFLWILAAAYNRDFVSAFMVVSHPFSAVVLLLLVISVAIHMRLGMAEVIADYLPNRAQRVAAVIANTFFSVAVGLVGVFAIVKLSVWRLLL